MKALLKGRDADVEQTGVDDTEAVIELRVNHDRELREMVRRCREVLAQRGPKDCPPGHWLG